MSTKRSRKRKLPPSTQDYVNHTTNTHPAKKLKKSNHASHNALTSNNINNNENSKLIPIENSENTQIVIGAYTRELEKQRNELWRIIWPDIKLQDAVIGNSGAIASNRVNDNKMHGFLTYRFASFKKKNKKNVRHWFRGDFVQRNNKEYQTKCLLYWRNKGKEYLRFIELNPSFKHCVVWNKLKSKFIHITAFCVDPNERNKGIGSKLFKTFLHSFPSETLFGVEVNCDNKNAIKIYQKNGFKIIRTVENYYENGTNAYKMTLKSDYQESDLK